jgi:Flp pilus assembly pilin Flp
METSMEKHRNFFKDESRAAAMEYALLVALIAVMIIASGTPLGKTLSAWFQTVATPVAAP